MHEQCPIKFGEAKNLLLQADFGLAKDNSDLRSMLWNGVKYASPGIFTCGRYTLAVDMASLAVGILLEYANGIPSGISAGSFRPDKWAGLWCYRIVEWRNWHVKQFQLTTYPSILRDITLTLEVPKKAGNQALRRLSRVWKIKTTNPYR